MRALFSLCLALLLTTMPAGHAAAQSEQRETRSAKPGAKQPAAEIADVAWLAGEWAGEGISGPATETYSAPLGGQMAGHFVQLKDGKVHFFEILSIAEVNGSLEYRLKHFNGDLTAWEDKEKVIRFPLVAVEDGAWFFDGLTVRKDGPNGMLGAVMVNLPQGRKEFVFRYKRLR
jgi:hypothetical protein